MPDAKRVLLHNTQTASMADKLRARFAGLEVFECNSYNTLPADITQHRPDAVYTVRFDAENTFPKDALFVPQGPAWIANGGAGTDHFGQWDKNRVTVTNAAGVAADMMAEYVMGCFLHFTLDVAGLIADKSTRRWSARSVRPLHGKTLVIVGLGHTGRAIAARAKAFGMTVLGTRANPCKMADVDEVHATHGLPQILPKADFIAVCTPLTPQTRGVIGPEELAALKSGAVFADVSRGGVTDQAALAQALRTGKLAGAACDVFETEPLPDDSTLWGVENLIISPHCSAVHDGWEDASFELFLDNLDRWLNGAPLKNVVDPDRGY